MEDCPLLNTLLIKQKFSSALIFFFQLQICLKNFDKKSNISEE